MDQTWLCPLGPSLRPVLGAGRRFDDEGTLRNKRLLSHGLLALERDQFEDDHGPSAGELLCVEVFRQAAFRDCYGKVEGAGGD